MLLDAESCDLTPAAFKAAGDAHFVAVGSATTVQHSDKVPVKCDGDYRLDTTSGQDVELTCDKGVLTQTGNVVECIGVCPE